MKAKVDSDHMFVPDYFRHMLLLWFMQAKTLYILFKNIPFFLLNFMSYEIYVRYYYPN